MKLDKLLDTEEKRQGIIMSLQALHESEGWQFVSAVLESNVQELQLLINDTESDRTEKEEWRLKVKREYQNFLIDLPKKFASDLNKGDNVEETGLDPYE